MNSKVKYGLIGALLAAFLGYQVFAIMRDDAPPAPPEVTPSVRPDVTVAPAPSAPPTSEPPVAEPDYSETPLGVDPDLDGDGEVTQNEYADAYGLDHHDLEFDLDTSQMPPATNDVRFDQGLIERAAEAWSTWSHIDANANSWTDRVAELSTTEYGHAMRTTFPLTSVVAEDWRRNFVTPQGETRVADVTSELLGGTESTGWLRFRVEYTIQVKYADAKKAPIKAKSGAWTKLQRVAYEFEYTVENDEWLLFDVDVSGAPAKGTVSYGDLDH